MKTILMCALLGLTPALFAAEPNPNLSTPAEPSTKAPFVQEDVADQAALVQQLGEEASRGFDPEVHAHALRVQIEALLSAPAESKEAAPINRPPVVKSPLAPVAGPVTPTHTPRPTPAPVVSRDSAAREAVQKVRAALDELEAQLNRTQKAQ